MNHTINKMFFFLIVVSVTISRVYAQETKVSLQEALQLAKTNNKSLNAERFESQAVSEMSKGARGFYKPSINLNSAYSYYFNRPVIFMRRENDIGNWDVMNVEVGGRNAFNASISLYQPIFNESFRRDIKTARISELIQHQRQLDHESALVEDVSASYFTVLLLQQKKYLNDQSLERNIKSLRDSRELFFQGKSLRSDTLRNFIAVENLKSSRSFLNDELDLEMMRLKKLMGLSHIHVVSLTDTLVTEINALDNISEEELDQAMERRQDIKQMNLTYELRKNLLSHAKSSKLPQVGIAGIYQLQNVSDNLKFNDYTWPPTSFIGIQGSVPIFNGNRNNARIKQHKARLSQSEVELEDLKENARIEIASTMSKLRGARTQVFIHSQTVEAAQLNFNMMDERYQNGLASRLEVTDSEVTLTQAKLNYYQAIYRYNLLEIYLQRATGQLNF